MLDRKICKNLRYLLEDDFLNIHVALNKIDFEQDWNVYISGY